jgi:poly-gamma-glutamate synthesis protein (capsule biosynthesis protein)
MTVQSSKFIFLLFILVFFSGCTRNISGESTVIHNISKISEKKETAQAFQKQIKILFVGDMMFDRYIREAIGKYGDGNYDYIFEKIKNKLADYDLVVGNLEGPITDKKSVSVGSKEGESRHMVFTFDPAVAKALFDNNIKLVNLGNNHILNQGEKGVEQTKKYLTDTGVEYFGDTGEMEVEPPRGGSTSKVLEIGEMRIGFVNYNYSVAGSFERAVENIKLAKKQSDIVVVCPHWGTEYKVGDPGPAIRDMARKFIDAGADAVIGTHPHVIQASEDYKDKKIYYSLGNFVFDQYFQEEIMEGLGVEMTVNPDDAIEYSELKFEMTKKGQTIFKAKP